MKLDMYEINKLNPTGLIELASLVALIKKLMGLLDGYGLADAISLRTAQMIGQAAKQLREGRYFNLNLRIKTWVLQTAERRAWVRSVIGENSIRKWQQDYDALARHELPVRHKRTGISSNHSSSSAVQTKPSENYAPKQFALPRLSDIFIRSLDLSLDSKLSPVLTGLGNVFTIGKIPEPEPVIFWPHELEESYVPEPCIISDETDTESDTVSKPKTEQTEKTGEQLDPKPP